MTGSAWAMRRQAARWLRVPVGRLSRGYGATLPERTAAMTPPLARTEGALVAGRGYAQRGGNSTGPAPVRTARGTGQRGLARMSRAVAGEQGYLATLNDEQRSAVTAGIGFPVRVLAGPVRAHPFNRVRVSPLSRFPSVYCRSATP